MVKHHFTTNVDGTTCGIMGSYYAVVNVRQVTCSDCLQILKSYKHFWSNTRKRTLCGIEGTFGTVDVAQVTCPACLEDLGMKIYRPRFTRLPKPRNKTVVIG